jgi:acyl-CoA thioesterase I
LGLQSKWLAIGIALVILVASMTTYVVVTQLYEKKIVKIACVGDSITADANYPDLLDEMLGSNYQVVNFGVGRTTVSLDFEKPYLNQSTAKLAHWFNPDIVVMMLGTNDAYLSSQQRSNFISDYTTLINSFQTLSSKPKIYILIPPPVFENNLELNGTIVENEILPLVKQTANSLGLPLIDVHTVLLNHPENFKDGVHPNSEGAKIIAIQVYNTITKDK